MGVNSRVTAAQQQTAWFVDSVSGSDSASGAVGAPLQTFSALIDRVAPGGTFWQVPQTTTVTLLNDLLPTDLVALRVRLLNGANLKIVPGANINADPGGSGMKLFSAASSFTATRTKNPTTTPGIFWGGTDAGANWTNALHLLVHDTTTGAYFWVNKNEGAGVARFSEPVTMPAIGSAPLTAPTKVAFSGQTDAYTVLQPLKTYFSSVVVESEALGPGGAKGVLYVDGMWNQRAALFEAMNMVFEPIGTFVACFSRCRFDNLVDYIGSPVFSNCSFNGGHQCEGGSFAILCGESTQSSWAITGAPYGFIDGGHIITISFISFNMGSTRLGDVGFDVSSTLQVGSVDFPGKLNIEAQLYGVAQLWGNIASLLVRQGSTIVYPSASTSAASIPACASVRLGGNTSAVPQNPTTGAYGTSATLTFVNIDTAFVSGGFGGFAQDIASGARICKVS